MNGQTQIDFDSPHMNSLFVWYEKIKPTLSSRRAEVLESIVKLHKASCYEVCNYLSGIRGYAVTPNLISGRFTELKKLNLIKSAGKKEINGTKHEVWEPCFD